MIGQAIKRRRKELNITQPILADMAGISVNTLYKIERGEANPRLDTLEKIANTLGFNLTLEVPNPHES
ncbi:MAG: helix-turn-helix transcriptional regulator [Bacteroidota bacterium]